MKRTPKLTPKQFVLTKFPKAELVRDGIHASRFFDFAIFSQSRLIAMGPTPQTAWDEARRVIERKRKGKLGRVDREAAK